MGGGEIRSHCASLPNNALKIYILKHWLLSVMNTEYLGKYVTMSVSKEIACYFFFFIWPKSFEKDVISLTVFGMSFVCCIQYLLNLFLRSFMSLIPVSDRSLLNISQVLESVLCFLKWFGRINVFFYFDPSECLCKRKVSSFSQDTTKIIACQLIVFLCQ